MGRLDEDPTVALGDHFQSWCEDNDLDPADTDLDEYLEAMADLDPRIGEEEYRQPY